MMGIGGERERRAEREGRGTEREREKGGGRERKGLWDRGREKEPVARSRCRTAFRRRDRTCRCILQEESSTVSWTLRWHHRGTQIHSDAMAHSSNTKAHYSDTKAHYSDTWARHSDTRAHYSDTRAHYSDTRRRDSQLDLELTWSKGEGGTSNASLRQRGHYAPEVKHKLQRGSV